MRRSSLLGEAAIGVSQNVMLIPELIVTLGRLLLSPFSLFLRIMNAFEYLSDHSRGVLLTPSFVGHSPTHSVPP